MGWLAYGIPMQYCVPENTPRFKIEALSRANECAIGDGIYPEAEALAKETVTNRFSLCACIKRPRSDRRPGTVVRELLSQAPDVQTVVIAVAVVA